MGEQPAVPGNPPRQPARRRKGVSIALAVVILIVAGAGVAARQLIFAYDPIGLGGLSSDVSPGFGNAMVDFPGYRAMLVTAVAGKEFQLTWNIVNRGDRSVRVTAVPNPVPAAYVERTKLETGDGTEDERRGGSERVMVPFRPFELLPNEHRVLSATYRFLACPFAPFGIDYARELANGRIDVSPGAPSASWSEQRIDFEVWGVGRSSDLKLPWTIVLVNAHGECAAAQLR